MVQHSLNGGETSSLLPLPHRPLCTVPAGQEHGDKHRSTTQTLVFCCPSERGPFPEVSDLCSSHFPDLTPFSVLQGKGKGPCI